MDEGKEPRGQSKILQTVRASYLLAYKAAHVSFDHRQGVRGQWVLKRRADKRDSATIIFPRFTLSEVRKTTPSDRILEKQSTATHNKYIQRDPERAVFGPSREIEIEGGRLRSGVADADRTPRRR